jgi:hypothetical protein
VGGWGVKKCFLGLRQTALLSAEGKKGKRRQIICNFFILQYSNSSAEGVRGASAETEGCRPVNSDILMNLQRDIRPPPKDDLDHDTAVGGGDNRYENSRDIERMLEEQAFVPPISFAPPSAKVGFAAIQEMARLQEEALLRENKEEEEDSSSRGYLNMRFDPQENCLKLTKAPAEAVEKTLAAGLGRFPLEVSSPAQSPPSHIGAKVGLRRMGSHR